MSKRLGLYKVMRKIHLGHRLTSSERSFGTKMQRKRIDLIYNNKLSPKGKEEITYIIKMMPFIFGFDGFGDAINRKRNG